MKKGLGVIVGVVVVILLLVVSLGSSYNSMVKLSENVDSKYADISVQLKRRTDLIPNLINTVKGYMDHEQKIIDSVTEARTNLVNAKTVSEQAKANDELSSALNSLNVIVENYPDLKSNTNFIQLQDELAGTENRIAVSRKDYNDAVKDYNSTIKSFPKNIIAGMFGFAEKDYFEITNADKEVPNVSFD